MEFPHQGRCEPWISSAPHPPQHHRKSYSYAHNREMDRTRRIHTPQLYLVLLSFRSAPQVPRFSKAKGHCIVFIQLPDQLLRPTLFPMACAAWPGVRSQTPESGVLQSSNRARTAVTNFLSESQSVLQPGYVSFPGLTLCPPQPHPGRDCRPKLFISCLRAHGQLPWSQKEWF